MCESLGITCVRDGGWFIPLLLMSLQYDILLEHEKNYVEIPELVFDFKYSAYGQLYNLACFPGDQRET